MLGFRWAFRCAFAGYFAVGNRWGSSPFVVPTICFYFIYTFVT